ncbi:MAG: hypothetical protein AAGI10_06215 [Pseudomonadota bacterium]
MQGQVWSSNTASLEVADRKWVSALALILSTQTFLRRAEAVGLFNEGIGPGQIVPKVQTTLEAAFGIARLSADVPESAAKRGLAAFTEQTD